MIYQANTALTKNWIILNKLVTRKHIGGYGSEISIMRERERERERKIFNSTNF